MNDVIEVYYDRACALCRGEVEALAEQDRDGRIRLHDCSAPGFSDAEAARDGHDRAAMMRSMHVRDAEGRWHLGVDAFVAMYRAAGLDEVAAVLEHRRLKPIWKRVYPLVAANRRLLDRLGLAPAVRWFVRHAGERAARRRRPSESLR